jgi:hypothetical protein
MTQALINGFKVSYLKVLLRTLVTYQPSLTLSIGGSGVPPTGSVFPAWARSHAANSGRGIIINSGVRANSGRASRIIDYGVSSGSGYRPATYKARSSYGRR